MNGGFALVGHGMEGLWKPDDNARQYKSPGFETLLRSHDLWGRQRNLQGHQLRCPGRDELITTSIDGGINFFVTADNYTEGESEKILGQSLKNLHIARQHVVIASKVASARAGMTSVLANLGNQSLNLWQSWCRQASTFSTFNTTS